MSVKDPMILTLPLKPNEQVRRDSKEYAFLADALGLPRIQHLFESLRDNKVRWTRFFNNEFRDIRIISSRIPISFQSQRITEGAQYESLLDQVSEFDLTFTLIEGIENEAKFRIGNLGVAMSDSWILRNPIVIKSGIFTGNGYQCYYTFCNDVLLTSCSLDRDTIGMIIRQRLGYTLPEYVPVPWGYVHNLIATRFAPNRYLFGKEKKVDTKLYLSQDSVVSFDMADIQLPFGLGKHIRLDSNGLGTISSRDLRKIPLLLENIKGLMNLNSDFEIYVREVPQHCPVYSEGMNDESRDYKRYAWFSIKKTALSSIEPVKGELLIPGTILYNAAAEILNLPKTSEQFTSGPLGTFYTKTTKMMGKEISHRGVKANQESFDPYFMSNLCNEEAIVRKTAAFYKYFLARFGPWIDIVCEGCIGDEYVFSIDKLAYKYLSIISCVVDVKIVKLESIEFLSMFHPNPALLVFTDDLAWTEDSSGTRIATMLRSGEFTEYVHEEYEMTIEQRRIIYRNGLFMMLISDKTTKGETYGNKNLHPYSRT